MLLQCYGGPMDGAGVNETDLESPFGSQEPPFYRRGILLRNDTIPFRSGPFRYAYWDWCKRGEVGDKLPEYQLYQGRLVFIRHCCI